MTLFKFIKEKEKQAIALDKEESSIVLLLEHVLNCETNELYMKINLFNILLVIHVFMDMIS